MNHDSARLPSLALRLRRARREGFVGRAAELELFRRALDGDPEVAPVLLVHGPGGIGKTALLERFAQEADDAGRQVVRVDAAALDSATRTWDSSAPVLLVDRLDETPGLEDWLRDDLLPRLPENAVAVLAGRDRPGPEWHSDPGWRTLVEDRRLSPLDDDEATRLLRGFGTSSLELPALLRFAAGNPLALTMAVDDMTEPGQVPYQGPGRRVVRELLDRMIAPPPDVSHDLALRVCAHARHTTVDLLRAVLDDDDAATTAFAWLGGLPYVDPDPQGLRTDDLVGRLVDSDHRWRDPVGYEILHRSIWEHLGRRAIEVRDDLTTSAVDDLVHLQRYRFPELHESGALGDLDQLVEVDVGDDLGTTVSELAEAALGPAGRQDVEYWFARQPEAFSVYGPGGDEDPTAFLAVLRLTTPEPHAAAADPVVAAVWQHAVGDGALPPGEQIEVARFVVPRPIGGHLAAGDPRLVRWYDLIFRRAGQLTASYVVLHDPEPCVPFMVGLDHTLEAEVPAPGDLTWGVFVHDWRQVSLERHLERVLPSVGVVNEPASSVLLERNAFDEAVRQALHDWHDDDALAVNVLALRGTPHDGDPVSALRHRIAEAVGWVGEDPRRTKSHRAVSATYVQGAVTQEAAASRLGLPYSTYRRHLARGTALVCDRMWSQYQGG